MSRIVVGISGGVDSSVAAYLLKRAGHSVTGCRVRTFDTPESRKEEEESFRICEVLGIPLTVLDYREAFRKEVISYFAAEYAAGRTPNPCCVCNRTVKWQALLSCMRETGAEQVATGHYAVLQQQPGTLRFGIRSADTEKDQSYALYNLTQEELSRTVFPLAGYTKEAVRQTAAEAGLFTAEKPDSQEICFIPDNDYAAFLRREFGITETPGNFVDIQGHVLGRHSGIIHYTVGQRKGLGIALGKRVFVKEIRPLSNEVVLADDAEVFTDSAVLEKVNFQLAEPFGMEACGTDADRAESSEAAVSKAAVSEAEAAEAEASEAGLYGAEASEKALFGTERSGAGSSPREFLRAAKVRVRYADRGTPGSLRACGNGRYLLQFERPVRAVTPGQAAVLYGEDGCILCGGLICG